MSGLSMLCLLLFVNVFLGSYLAHQVTTLVLYSYVTGFVKTLHVTSYMQLYFQVFYYLRS